MNEKTYKLLDSMNMIFKTEKEEPKVTAGRVLPTPSNILKPKIIVKPKDIK